MPKNSWPYICKSSLHTCIHTYILMTMHNHQKYTYFQRSSWFCHLLATYLPPTCTHFWPPAPPSSGTQPCKKYTYLLLFISNYTELRSGMHDMLIDTTTHDPTYARVHCIHAYIQYIWPCICRRYPCICTGVGYIGQAYGPKTHDPTYARVPCIHGYIHTYIHMTMHMHGLPLHMHWIWLYNAWVTLRHL